MLQGIDLNQVRQYNASLKQYRDKAANINAQIEFNQKELANLCKELSAELGVEVNESNVEQIYNEQVEKINATLKSGNTVLAKIAEEENRIATGAPAQPVQQTSQPVQQTAQQVQAAQPIQNNQGAVPVPPTIPSTEGVFESNATAGSVFGNGGPTAPGGGQLFGATNLFALGTGQ